MYKGRYTIHNLNEFDLWEVVIYLMVVYDFINIMTQVEEIEVVNDPEPESSITDSDSSLDEIEVEEPESRTKRMLVIRAIFVLLISVLAAFFVNWKPVGFDVNVG